ncbi:high affinity immunoglobulin epsilon receptor subunit beta-like [Tamandua tetradactyla]|uniref:high affinity immunoglobulin epsilon receptor subunit beta-like n=1 Tax=Tamandua tetradactyla TaxID=48850 RepID=UPI0040544F23
MSQTLDSGGMTMDSAPVQTQDNLLGKSEAPGTSGHIQDRLQKFLKENLKALGVAQILLGMQCMFYGIIGFFVLHSEKYRIILFSFHVFFPLWGALSFITSGSLTVAYAKKQTKSLLQENLGANMLSTFVSISGLCILSYNLIKLFHYDCKGEIVCSGIKSTITISALPCWKSASEGPYQDLLPQAAIYEDLKHKDTPSNYTVTVNQYEASPL